MFSGRPSVPLSVRACVRPSEIHVVVFTGRQRSCKPCTSYDRDVRPSFCPSVHLSVTRWH